VTGHLTPTKGTLRVCRGVVLAVASATLAIAAHGIAGGGMPGTAPTLLLSFGVSATGIALANRRYSLGAVAVLLGVTQLVTHLLLSVDSGGMSGMSPETFNGLTMLGAHGAAVLITSLLLVWADTLLFALAKALRRLRPVLVTPAPITVRRRCPRPSAAPRGLPTAVSLCRGNARRGPPVAA
jgi:hypothetical protein